MDVNLLRIGYQHVATHADIFMLVRTRIEVWVNDQLDAQLRYTQWRKKYAFFFSNNCNFLFSIQKIIVNMVQLLALFMLLKYLFT